MIIEMYGRCDTYDVVFTQIGEGLWTARVPADHEDGKYIVEIWARDTTGVVIYWTGILYMYDGQIVLLQLTEDPFRVCIGTSDDNIVFGVSDDTIRFGTCASKESFVFGTTTDTIEVRVSFSM